MADPRFSGFPPQTFRFLEGLARHNSKAWFDAHRADYEAYYLAPARAFVVALGKALGRPFPGVRAEPNVNGSIRRINRDIRFSKDKRPYHPTLRLALWDGLTPNSEAPAFHVWMEAERVHLGAGVYAFSKAGLERYRAAVVDEEPGSALARAVAQIERAGYRVSDDHFKRVPRGYDPHHPRAGLLLKAGLFGGRVLEIPREASSPGFVGFCAGHFRKLGPLYKALAALRE